jgi:ferredoxin-type protein NapH
MFLPAHKKELGRKLAQILVGGYMLVYLGIISFENMQIEGFFSYLIAGIYTGAVIHYLVAKILGPLLFNRAWCGWTCWTAMVLDFLPYASNKQGRLEKKWGYLRYVHFLLSLGFVVALLFVFKAELSSATEFLWLLIGNALYYCVGIIMAFVLKDNRAFCKYICPIPVLQKIPARFSLIKIAGKHELCNECNVCTKMCPMDIKIPEYIKAKKRVLSTECTLCLICTNVCPKKVLHPSVGFDISKKEFLKYRK